MNRLRLPDARHVVDEEAEERAVGSVGRRRIRLAETSGQDCGQDRGPLDDDRPDVQTEIGVVADRLGKVVGQELDVQTGKKGNNMKFQNQIFLE